MRVQVDGCSKLAAQQYLGAGPFYLYLGTQCSAGDCPGDSSSRAALQPHDAQTDATKPGLQDSDGDIAATRTLTGAYNSDCRDVA